MKFIKRLFVQLSEPPESYIPSEEIKILADIIREVDYVVEPSCYHRDLKRVFEKGRIRIVHTIKFAQERSLICSIDGGGIRLTKDEGNFLFRIVEEEVQKHRDKEDKERERISAIEQNERMQEILNSVK